MDRDIDAGDDPNTSTDTDEVAAQATDWLRQEQSQKEEARYGRKLAKEIHEQRYGDGATSPEPSPLGGRQGDQHGISLRPGGTTRSDRDATQPERDLTQTRGTSGEWGGRLGDADGHQGHFAASAHQISTLTASCAPRLPTHLARRVCTLHTTLAPVARLISLALHAAASLLTVVPTQKYTKN